MSLLPSRVFRGLALVALLVAAPGRAADDERPFALGCWGESVVVPQGVTHAGDVLALGALAEVDGDVQGHAVALFGDVVVRGTVSRDALAAFGSVRVEGPRGAVGRHALSLFGNVTVGAGGSVGGESRALLAPRPGAREGLLAYAFSRQGFLLRLWVTLFWVVAALVAAVLAPRRVIAASGELARRPARVAGIGLVLVATAVLAGIACIALVVLVVGLPLLALLAAVLLVLASIAIAGACHRVGGLLLRKRVDPPASAYAQVLVGLLAFSLVQFIPVLGEAAWILAVLGGAGAVLVTGRSRS